MKSGKPIRVLIVDDSAIVRKILMETLAAEPDIEVVGTASDPYFARDKILALKPDVLTLDIEMPRMDGLTFLKKLMHYHPMPVIVISSLAQSSCQAAMDALRFGAVEAMAKPSGPFSVGELRQTLASKVRAAAVSIPGRTLAPADPSSQVTPPVAKPLASAKLTSPRLIALGASTGGVSALQQVLMDVPGDLPGIVIAQHIPENFSRAFATRLDKVCGRLTVKEAEDGEAVYCGYAYIAPGNRHLVVQKSSGGYTLAVKDGPQVCFQRPSVDVLFHSVAQAAGASAVGAILTGMGKDGANGLLAMRKAGAHTIAQDEASCVVYGMPREAISVGAATEVKGLLHVGTAIQSALATRR
jgi:two-component system chemotaxis response regulator CheB